MSLLLLKQIKIILFIAFKQAEIYKINALKGKDYTVREKLIGKSGALFGADTLDLELITSETGCASNSSQMRKHAGMARFRWSYLCAFNKKQL